VRVLCGGHAPGAAVSALALLPARRAASAGEDGCVAVWSLLIGSATSDAESVAAASDAALLRRTAPLGAPLLSLACADHDDADDVALWAGAADGSLHRVRCRDAAVTLSERGLADGAPLRALCALPSGVLIAGTGRGDVHTYELLPAAEAAEQEACGGGGGDDGGGGAADDA
jgi:hypothetical protein